MQIFKPLDINVSDVGNYCYSVDVSVAYRLKFFPLTPIAGPQKLRAPLAHLTPTLMRYIRPIGNITGYITSHYKNYSASVEISRTVRRMMK